MSATEAQLEALAEAVVFAHEADAPALPPADRNTWAFERTAALALAGLARPAAVPPRLQALLAADGARFAAARSRVLQLARRPVPLRRAVPVLAFVFGVAAGVTLFLLLARRERLPEPAVERRAALLAVDATAVRIPWQAGPSPLHGEVSGDVVWSAARQEGYLTFRGLPALDAEHRFQLWIVDGAREGAPVDGGLFAIVDAGHETVVPVQAKLPIGKPAAFVVTVETKAGAVVSKQEHVVAIAGL